MLCPPPPPMLKNPGYATEYHHFSLYMFSRLRRALMNDGKLPTEKIDSANAHLVNSERNDIVIDRTKSLDLDSDLRLDDKEQKHVVKGKER